MRRLCAVFGTLDRCFHSRSYLERMGEEVFEWRIDNFSCWDERLHGNSIHSPKSSGLDHFQQLFIQPNGIPFIGEQVAVFFEGRNSLFTHGNFSLMGSDGSVFYTTRRFQAEFSGYWIFCGLKLEEMLDQIKSKGDQIILRFSVPSETEKVEKVSTALAFLNFSISVDPLSIKDMEEGDSKNISMLHYDKKNVHIILLLKSYSENKRLDFILELLFMSCTSIIVQGRWRLQTGENTFIRNEEDRRLFEKCEPWLVSCYSLSELTAEGTSILFDFKIISNVLIENEAEASIEEIEMIPLKTAVYVSDHVSVKINGSADKSCDSTAELKSDFMSLYQDHDYSDLTLKCDDVTFLVHRAILSARSPVFKIMLSSDMREASSGQVDIGDLHPSTLTRFLAFLYTGQVEEGLDGEGALNLYYAAEKYQVSSLKKECQDFLRSNVSISNVCDILSCAEKYGDKEFDKVSHDFLMDNYNQVLRSSEWEKFIIDDPFLAAKTMTRLGQQNQVGKI